MAKTIVQKIVFKNTTPKQLYDLYMDAKKHSIATAAPVKITAKEGAKYSVHGGYAGGKNLQLVKNKLIVQTWSAQDWDKGSLESILIIQLEPKGNDTVLYMTHANVPDKHAASLSKGWKDYYWSPWKQYLAGKPIVQPKAM